MCKLCLLFCVRVSLCEWVHTHTFVRGWKTESLSSEWVMPRCSILLQRDSEKGTGFCSPSPKVKTHMAYTVKPEAAKQQESLFNMLDQRNSHWCERAGNLHTGTGRPKTGGQKAEVVDGDPRLRKWPGFRQESKIGKSGNRKLLSSRTGESCEWKSKEQSGSECVESLSTEPVLTEIGKRKSWRGVSDMSSQENVWRCSKTVHTMK